MQWPEILRDLAQRLEDARQAMMADIEHDLRSQGASPRHIADSIAGVDAVFDQRLQRVLADFVRALEAEMHASPRDGTFH